MTGERRAAALAGLVEAVRQLEGLTEQVGPFALPPDTCDTAPELVAAVCAALGVPLSFDGPDGERDFAVAALAAGLQRAQRVPDLAGLRPDDVAALAAAARQASAEEDAVFRRHEVRRPDGAVVTAVETGPPDAPAILLSPACAMPYRLSLRWLRALGGDYRCVVLQTRGTNGRIDDPAEFDRHGYGVECQAGDLVAVIEALALGAVHLMGLCGGAVPALVVAAEWPEYVRSLSVWHADLDFAGETEKTDHQVNLRALLDLASESRDTAAWMRDRLASGPMTGVPEAVGPLVVRPYATAELFYRYAKLTGATMHWNSGPTAARVTQPCLVVTSRDDNTAHPAGSRRLAELLPGSRFVETEHGTHLDAFEATAEQVSCLTSFLAEIAAPQRENAPATALWDNPRVTVRT